MIIDDETVQDTVKPDTAPAAGPETEEADKTEAKAEEETAEAAKPKSEEELAKEATEAAQTLNRRKQSAREAVQQAKGRQRDAERRAASLERENAELRARLKPVDPSQFADDAEYTAAKVEHNFDRRQLDRNEQELRTTEEDRVDALGQSWRARTADFREEAPDFDDIVYGKLNNRISGDTAMLIAELDEGPAVAYHLGKNIAEATRINSLPEREKAFALGKIAERITQTPPRRTTQAPAPIETVGGKSSGGRGFDPHKASVEEFSERYIQMKKREAS